MKQKSERAKRREIRAAAEVGRAVTLSRAVADDITAMGGVGKLSAEEYTAVKKNMHRALRGLPPKT